MTCTTMIHKQEVTDDKCMSQTRGWRDLEDPVQVFSGFTVIQLNRIKEYLGGCLSSCTRNCMQSLHGWMYKERETALDNTLRVN